MRRRVGLALLGLALVVPALANVAQLTQPVLDALTPLDTLPSREQLKTAHGSDQAALDNLQLIALAQGTVDPGVQLRAVRVLPQYCNLPCPAADPAHTTLVTLATTPRYRDSRRGSDLLVLRAAIEAIGVLRVPDDVSLLIPQLEHPSRDIRAATARALRDLGNTQAIVPLRARYTQEQVGQVRLAISDALRVLGQPVP
jgi:HEAT repeat protein